VNPEERVDRVGIGTDDRRGAMMDVVRVAPRLASERDSKRLVSTGRKAAGSGDSRECAVHDRMIELRFDGEIVGEEGDARDESPRSRAKNERDARRDLGGSRAPLQSKEES
jgi:hypothetical protein